ncbi:hypothetical protein V2I01_00910 [Micromonospora sp. BRA006-A]|nr:hypothetical protein [Micromonospora sp. BRA006-A]
MQETAVRTAVEQAELRRSVRDVFLSLARRTRALVHRQLTLLDAMERREHDAEELEDLFRVDHLATRMRRNAENLIVLSGSTPGRPGGATSPWSTWCAARSPRSRTTPGSPCARSARCRSPAAPSVT